MDVDVWGEIPASIFRIYTEDGGGVLLQEYVRVWRCEERVPAPCSYPLLDYSFLTYNTTI